MRASWLSPAVSSRSRNPQSASRWRSRPSMRGYIEHQRLEVARGKASESVALPAQIDYREVRGLSAEVQQKLSQHRPETIGQASRISGVTPAAISLLLVHLKKKRFKGFSNSSIATTEPTGGERDAA